MAAPVRWRGAIAAAGALGLVAVLGGLGACGSTAGGDQGCAAYRQYGTFPGRTVDVLAGLSGQDGTRQEASYTAFTRCTGITIRQESTPDVATALTARVAGGKPPDLAFLARPGLLADLVHAGAVKPAPRAVAALVDRGWPAVWKGYGTVDGTLYAAPLDATVKSLVWYAPKSFEANSFKAPASWDDLLKLSDTIAARGVRPWCDGFAAPAAAGSAGTDWIEDLLLRTGGPDVYDRWARHEIPFDDPRVQAAFDRAGAVLKNDRYVNGGHGGVRSVATTPVEDGPLPILSGTCAMSHQASSSATRWGPGIKVARDGDVFAFPLPPVDLPPVDAAGRRQAGRQPVGRQRVVAGGEFVAAFTDRPEVVAVQTYLASAQWARTRAGLGGWASANTGLGVGDVSEPIQQLAVRLLHDPTVVVRLDGSDQMPATVGSGSFPRAMLDWIEGRSTAQVTAGIEASWPAAGQPAAGQPAAGRNGTSGRVDG